MQTVHLERGIKIVDSPGVIFDDEPSGSDKLEGTRSTIHLRNVLRPEDFDDPIAVGKSGILVFHQWYCRLRSGSSVEEILARVDPDTVRKIYNLPLQGGEPGTGSTLEFLTMLALTSGRLLKVSSFALSI